MHYDVCSTVSAAPTTELEQGCAQNGEAAYIQLKCPVGSVIIGSSKRLSRQYIMHFNTSFDMKPSGQYRDRPDSIETVRTVLKPPGRYQNVRAVSKLSGQYQNRPDTIETVRTVLK